MARAADNSDANKLFLIPLEMSSARITHVTSRNYSPIFPMNYITYACQAALM